jgi:hypothetical protein
VAVHPMLHSIPESFESIFVDQQHGFYRWISEKSKVRKLTTNEPKWKKIGGASSKKTSLPSSSATYRFGPAR